MERITIQEESRADKTTRRFIRRFDRAAAQQGQIISGAGAFVFIFQFIGIIVYKFKHKSNKYLREMLTQPAFATPPRHCERSNPFLSTLQTPLYGLERRAK
jgi:hypothetical protein